MDFSKLSTDCKNALEVLRAAYPKEKFPDVDFTLSVNGVHSSDMPPHAQEQDMPMGTARKIVDMYSDVDYCEKGLMLEINSKTYSKKAEVNV